MRREPDPFRSIFDDYPTGSEVEVERVLADGIRSFLAEEGLHSGAEVAEAVGLGSAYAGEVLWRTEQLSLLRACRVADQLGLKISVSITRSDDK